MNGAAAFSGFAVTESGSGTTLLKGSTALDTAAALYLDGGRVVENQGSLGWGSGGILLGFLPSGAPVGGGTLENAAGATIDAQADDQIAAGSGATAFGNAGVLHKSAGTGATVISVPFTNTGSIVVDAGTLDFDHGGSSNAAGVRGVGRARRC